MALAPWHGASPARGPRPWPPRPARTWGFPSLRRALAAEYEAHADRGMDHLVAERGTRQVVKAVAGAMRGDQIIRIDLAEFLDGRADVVVAERRHHVEAADHGQHLVDAGGGDRLAHGVDDAAMAARGEHHQAFVLDPVDGGEFVLDIVRDVAAGILLRRHLFGEAAEAVEYAD